MKNFIYILLFAPSFLLSQSIGGGLRGGSGSQNTFETSGSATGSQAWALKQFDHTWNADGTGRFIINGNTANNLLDVDGVTEMIGIGLRPVSARLDILGLGSDNTTSSFRAANAGVSTLEFTDGGQLNITASSASPGKVQIFNGGSGTANANADDFFIRGNSNIGMTMTSGTSSSVALYMGDSSNPLRGGMKYQNSIDALALRANGLETLFLFSNRRVSIGGQSSTYSFTLDYGLGGTSAIKTIGVSEATSGLQATAIKLVGGPANSSETDGNGGDFIASSGTGRGTGSSGCRFFTHPPGTTGTTATTEQLSVHFKPAGQVQWNTYGKGNYTGTPSKITAVTADGDNIELDVLQGSSIQTAITGDTTLVADDTLKADIKMVVGDITGNNTLIRLPQLADIPPGKEITVQFSDIGTTYTAQVAVDGGGVNINNGTSVSVTDTDDFKTLVLWHNDTQYYIKSQQ
ncbi:MAG: hypothetical protein AAFZ15_17335 [Bacteroidota bacterium]